VCLTGRRGSNSIKFDQNVRQSGGPPTAIPPSLSHPPAFYNEPSWWNTMSRPPPPRLNSSFKLQIAPKRPMLFSITFRRPSESPALNMARFLDLPAELHLLNIIEDALLVESKTVPSFRRQVTNFSLVCRRRLNDVVARFIFRTDVQASAVRN